MKKIGIFLTLGGLLITMSPALAEVSVVNGPTSLVSAPMVAQASSSPIGLFEFSLTQTEGETLSSVSVIIDKTASSTLSVSDINNVAVYKDNGDSVFNAATDLLAGTQSITTLNASTSVSVTSNNGIATSTKFFITGSTSSSWNDAIPADAFYATLPTNTIITSSNSPTSTSAISAVISADTTGPILQSVVARNTGGTNAKEPGDSIDFVFSEPTNKPVATSTNIGSLFSLDNGHSFLDSLGTIGSATWNTQGTVLTLVLGGTASTTVATVALGDTVSVVTPSTIIDSVSNKATGVAIIIGSFSGIQIGGDLPGTRGKCSNGLINGRLYRVQNETKIYIAAGCRLKLFMGNAAGKAQGKKFKNIITIPSTDGLIVKQKPKHIMDPVPKKTVRNQIENRNQCRNYGNVETISQNKQENGKGKGKNK